MAWVGRPLVGRVGAKNEAEGYFRFAMMRMRENAESVALMRRRRAREAALLGPSTIPSSRAGSAS